MSTGPVPPERLPETIMMDAKFQDSGRDPAVAPPAPFGGDAEPLKLGIATSAAMAALGAGMAGHAFGVWLSAVSNALEVAQRLTAMAAGVAAPEEAPDLRQTAAPAGAGPVAAAATVAAAPKALARPAAPDDLKAIGGIGPKLEKVLNGLGVWTYAQIAGLSAGEIQWLDEHLGFRGRIARDEWVKQAGALAAARA